MENIDLNNAYSAHKILQCYEYHFHILCKVIFILTGLQLELIEYWIKMKGNHWVFNFSWWC